MDPKVGQRFELEGIGMTIVVKSKNQTHFFVQIVDGPTFGVPQYLLGDLIESNGGVEIKTCQECGSDEIVYCDLGSWSEYECQECGATENAYADR